PMRRLTEHALEILQRLVKDYPDVAAYRNELAQARIFLAMAVSQQGDHRSAAQHLDGVVRDITAPSWLFVYAYKSFLHHTLESAYALAADAARRDSALSDADRAALVANYQQRGVERLRAAFEAGYPNTPGLFAEWKADPDLKGLRDTPGFRALSAEIARRLDA